MDLIEEVDRGGMIMTLRVSPRNLDYVLGGLRMSLSFRSAEAATGQGVLVHYRFALRQAPNRR